MTSAEPQIYQNPKASLRSWNEFISLQQTPRACVAVGHQLVGDGQPVFVIGEIGINHNGSLELAKRLIAGAKKAGCDAVKFQKRTVELCVPREQWRTMRDTPWGRMSYIDYKRRIEFGLEEFIEIDRFCREIGIRWFSSCWDEESVDFIERFDPPCYKAASASLTDHALLRKMKATGRPLMASTGMSSWNEVLDAFAAIGERDLLIAHSTSAYPCPPTDLNLRVIQALKERFSTCPIGYSGHETGLASTWAAVALGATFVERHITLDKDLWGTDHAASVDLKDLEQLVAQIRELEQALGDGKKRVYESELGARKKLRRIKSHEDRA